jgi:hypothetical protein
MCQCSKPKGRFRSVRWLKWQTVTLETEFRGQRLSTREAANEPRDGETDLEDPAHSVRGSNPKGHSKSGAVATSQTATLETEFCGKRLSSPRATNEPQRRWNRLGGLTTDATSLGNTVLFCDGGNQVGLRGLLGGAEGIRTSDLRSQAPAPSRSAFTVSRKKGESRGPRLSQTAG